MSYELTLEQFENLNLFSNRNMEKVMTGVVNSSSNAALVNMGEDSVILLDHKSGDFYITDYEFDRKNLTIEFTNYERIDLIDDSTDFESDVKRIFENDEDIDFENLTESYRRNVAEKDSFINEIVSFTMSRKSFNESVDYDEISEINYDLELSSKNNKFFESYVQRINDYPLTEVKRFDWINPVKVSLYETEIKTLVNKNAIQKAHDLWKKDSFQESFEYVASVMIENVEEGKEELKKLFENFPQVYFLDSADRRTLLGKTILNTSLEIRESMEDILKGIDILFENGELGEIQQRYLSEDDAADFQAARIADEDDEDMDDDMDDDFEEAPEVDESEMENMIDDLSKIASKCEDMRTKTRLEDLIDKMGSSIGEGTRPALVKEAVAILSL